MGKDKLYCNRCGKVIKSEKNILKEDAFEAKKEWGYFSEKDLEVHQFTLCEGCYDTIVAEFRIPVKIKNKRDVLGNEIVS